MTRHLLLEGAILAAAGGLLGAALAVWAVDLLSLVLPTDIPRLTEIRIDGAVLGFAAGVAALAGTVFGLAPALQMASGHPGAALADGGRSDGAGSGAFRARGWLVAAHVTLAVLLMVSSGLLVRSFWNLQRVEAGFDPNGVLTLELSLPASRYPGPGEIVDFKTRLLDAIAALPGVRSTATAYNHPLEATWTDVFRIVGRPEPAPGNRPGAWMRPIGHDYFKTAGVALRRGRGFTPSDDLDHPGVVVVNETFARRYFPDQDPIGQRLALSQNLSWPTPVEHEIVGVAGDVGSSVSTPTPNRPSTDRPPSSRSDR